MLGNSHQIVGTRSNRLRDRGGDQTFSHLFLYQKGKKKEKCSSFAFKRRKVKRKTGKTFLFFSPPLCCTIAWLEILGNHTSKVLIIDKHRRCCREITSSLDAKEHKKFKYIFPKEKRKMHPFQHLFHVKKVAKDMADGAATWFNRETELVFF